MAQQIIFNASAISAAGAEVGSHNGHLNSTLKDALVQVQRLSGWEGNAGEASLQKFQKLSQKYFDKMYQDIERYSKFLTKAAADYTTTETKIAGNAGQSTGSFFPS